MADIFREIDEDLRRDNLKRLWERFGLFIVAAAVLIVLIAAAVAGWQAWQRGAAQEASQDFTAAVAALDPGADEAENAATPEARAAFEQLAEEAPAGYAALAAHRQAALLADEGETERAVAAYDALAAEEAGGDILGELAALKAALLLVGTAPPEDVRTRLEPLAEPGRPWRHSAIETLAALDLEEGNFANADRRFEALIDDPLTPPSIRSRAASFRAWLDPRVEANDGAGEEQEGAAQVPAGESAAENETVPGNG